MNTSTDFDQSAAPSRDDMELTTEGGLRIPDPQWGQVEAALRSLDVGHGNSFAALSLPENTYVRALRGFNGYHLEWRISGRNLSDYAHYRASVLGGAPQRVELKKHDAVSPGQHRDLLCLEDVLCAFHVFHQGEPRPEWLDWVEIDV